MPHMPDFRFSSQSLQDYVECQRRFALRYIQKLDWPAEESSPYLAFEQFRQKGNQFHACIDQYFHNVDPQAIESRIMDEELRQWWESFLQFMAGKDFTFSTSEILFQTSLNNHVLIAKFDLLVKQTNADFTIYDWKTTAGEKGPNLKYLKEKMQTRIYPYVLCRSSNLVNGKQTIQPAQVELVYWFPQFPDQSFCFPYSSVQMQDDENIMAGLMNEIDKKSVDDFPKTEDDKRCRFCVYRSYCGRGKQAANIFEGETEFDFDLSDLDLDFEKIEEISY
ncbi:MAG: PD-(D/E)XK nuclease family protein [Anaerolineaceae bacterium]